MNNKQTQAINLFFNQFPDLKLSKYKIKKVKQGFTNSTFLMCINHKKYQIRIADNNNIVNRQNEFNTLLNLKNNLYIYYDLETGNSIKEWIEGTNLVNKIISKKIINALNEEIINLHKTEINQEIIKFDPLVFFDLTKDYIHLKYQNLYLELISKIKDKSLVLSHNDISLVNVIYFKNKIYLIDFEWTRINHNLWDYANFIREANLSLNKIKYWTKINKDLEFNELLNFLFLTTCYALQWTYATKQNAEIIKYRKKTLKKIAKYYKYLELNKNE